MQSTLFSTTYLGPIQFYAHLFNANKVFIEKHCNYIKQTYRNRCIISAANGPLSLAVPVDKQNKAKCPTRDIRISYDTPWQKLHWRSIVSAYNSSPYFEYYQDDFRPFYENKFDYLFDFNFELMKIVMDAIGYKPQIHFTNEYIPQSTNDYKDLRDVIHPKKKAYLLDPEFKSIHYRQLFEQKFGFTENISIIDLIFNKGPESLLVLKDSIHSKL